MLDIPFKHLKDRCGAHIKTSSSNHFLSVSLPPSPSPWSPSPPSIFLSVSIPFPHSLRSRHPSLSYGHEISNNGDEKLIEVDISVSVFVGDTVQGPEVRLAHFSTSTRAHARP